MIIETKVGPQVSPSGQTYVRGGAAGELVVQELHGRFYEQAYRGNIYSGGISALTSIANSTFTVATLTASMTPIVGVYNPPLSGKNMVILQASLGLTVTAATATGPGPFAWAMGITTTAVTTGNAPLNRATLQATGSVGKDISNVAPTGLTPSVVVRFCSALNVGLIKNISSVETAVGQNMGFAGTAVENFDGNLIVPPGGVLALLSTTTAVAHSAVSSIVWEEVPI